MKSPYALSTQFATAITILVVALTGCSSRTDRAIETAQVDSPSPSDADGSRPGIEADKPPRAVNPNEAMKWRHLQWQNENGEIPPDALRRANLQRVENLQQAALRGQTTIAGIDPGQWIERGPDNVGGRTRSMVIDPTNPLRCWAGAVSGGIWHSSDGGQTWAPVDDFLPNLAICCLAIDPANPDILYAGTGEGFFNGDGLGGAGIYKSVDGGQTWSQLPSTANWDNVNRIAVSPTNSNVLLASRRFGGVYRSTNGGGTWVNRIGAQGSFFVAFDPTDGAKAVAHIIDYDFGANDWFHKAMYSTNAGFTWSNAAGLSHVPGFYSRIELAYAPSNPSIVYASTASDGGIWRSTDGGQSFTSRTINGSTGASWYTNPLWVDPTNPDFLVAGGYHFARSTDGGVTLTQLTNGYIMTQQPHPDCHYVNHHPDFDGVTNRTVYVGTDGGLWKTDNVYTASTASGWSPLDKTYRTTQFYGAAGDGPTGLIIGGTQDNGTQRLTPGSDLAHLMFGGDGGFCAIDFENPDFCYGEYINLLIHRSTNGGLTSSYITNGLSDAGSNANFIAPFIIDPNNPERILGGGRSLWRTNNARRANALGGPSWQSIRGPGTDNISAIAIAPGDSDVIWIGLNNGEVHRTTNGLDASPTWQAIDNNGGTDPLPNRYIERIVIDADDSERAYVALGGFSDDNLYATDNGGASFSDATGSGATGLPNAPINGLTRHPLQPQWLYAGTEVGIFASPDRGATWSAVNQGPANASVDELVFMHNSMTLLAATHGRGIFTLDVSAGYPVDFDGDGDVDLDDTVFLADCMNGPILTPTPQSPMTADICLLAYDTNEDGDVDLADAAAIQIAFTGE